MLEPKLNRIMKDKGGPKMSKKQVYLTTCERCGNSVTHVEAEIIPTDWLNVDEIGDLCPDCAEQYRRFMWNFMGEVPNFKYPEKWKPEKPYTVMLEEMEGYNA